jgi:hypothetical protein
MCDQLAAAKWNVNRFHGGSPVDHSRYKNLASFVWHEIAQKVRKHQIIVPDNQKLIAKLSNRRVKYAQDGRLWIESKQEMRARGVESPDLADSFCMAFGMQPLTGRRSRRVRAGNIQAMHQITTRATTIAAPGIGHLQINRPKVSVACGPAGDETKRNVSDAIYSRRIRHRGDRVIRLSHPLTCHRDQAV